MTFTFQRVVIVTLCLILSCSSWQEIIGEGGDDKNKISYKVISETGETSIPENVCCSSSSSSSSVTEDGTSSCIETNECNINDDNGGNRDSVLNVSKSSHDTDSASAINHDDTTEQQRHGYGDTTYDDDDDEEYDDDDDDEEEYEEVYEERLLSLNTWGKPQLIEGDEYNDTKKVVERTRSYMKRLILIDEQFETIRNGCRNEKSLCSFWAGQGECENIERRDEMIRQCSPACMTCHLLEDYLKEENYDYEYDDEGEEYDDDDDDEEEEYEEDDYYYDDEERPPQRQERGQLLPIAFGKPQNLGTTRPDEILSFAKDIHTYMTNVVYVEELYFELFEECENRYADCTIWAYQGECDENPDFMNFQCAPACKSCDQLDISVRCPVNESQPVVWDKPGQLNGWFERITHHDTYWDEVHGPLTIVSRPVPEDDDDDDDDDDDNDDTNKPWIITLDNFLSEEECNRLIEIGTEQRYATSMDVGELNIDGTFDSVESIDRTSTNAWCPESCRDDPIVGPVHERITNLTGVPYNNSEWLQLLRYEPGQFYRQHHDYISFQWDRPPGPRILTIFLYLNDVEAGGGTRFGELNITIMPKKGRALIWPSVLDEDPFEIDWWTLHEALEVEAGIKYGANAWLHQRDFKTPHGDDCV